MGRWREPAAKSSPYITPEGYKSLEQETKSLWEKRSEVTKALAAAAAEGDRSENAEYIYRKKQLREIDRRITYLQKRMPTLTIVSEVSDPNRIFFSAWVELETEQGELLTYRIVGPDEFDQHQDYISIDSPMARALIGKQVDDEITVQIKGEEHRYYVTNIYYND